MKKGDFPIHPTLITDDKGETKKFEGLTKREYFAGVALQGILSKYTLSSPTDQETVTKLAVQLSDELLTQLEK